MGDFNVELPRGVLGVIGDRALHGRRYQHVASLIAWLQNLGVRALNTYSDTHPRPHHHLHHTVGAAGQSSTQESLSSCRAVPDAQNQRYDDLGVFSQLERAGNLDHDDLWTWGRGRKRVRRTQIDYVCVTDAFIGRAAPLRHVPPILKKSDHVPVYALVELAYTIADIQVATGTPSKKGWAPNTDADMSAFKNHMVQLCINAPSLKDLESGLQHAVSSTPHCTASSSRMREIRTANAAVRDARKRLQQGDPYQRVQLVRDLRTAKREAKLRKNVIRLRSVRSGVGRQRVTLFLDIPEHGPTADREAWKTGAWKFGSERFCNLENDFQRQAQRLQELYSTMRAQQLDGISIPTMTLFDCLSARAESKKGKSTGQDQIPNEAYKALPFFCVILYWSLFKERQGNIESADPAFWKCMEYVGIPKPESESIPSLGNLRWISKLAGGQKWYQRGVRACLRRQLRPCDVWTFGFQKGRSTTDITSVLRHLLWIADTYHGHTIFLGCLDVKTAFDCMDHGLIARALRWRGVHPGTIFNIMRELSFVEARMSLPGCDPTEYFKFLRGGKQGGVDTPDIFTVVMEFVLGNSVHAWERQGLGFGCDAGDGSSITHFIWADNIFLVSGSARGLQAMIDDATHSLYESGLAWKPSSLQYLVAGDGRLEEYRFTCKLPGGQSMPLERVFNMKVLGEMLDDRGSTSTAVDYRKQCAEGQYWAHKHIFLSPAPVLEKLRAWERGPQCSAVFGCQSWCITKQLLQELWTWELKFLRRVFKMRWLKHVVPYHVYLQNTADKIKTWFRRHSVRPIHVRVLEAYHKAAWRELDMVIGQGRQPLKLARLCRSRVSWEFFKLARPSARSSSGWTQRSGGHKTSWEDLMVSVHGPCWRRIRDNMGKQAWKSDFPVFAKAVFGEESLSFAISTHSTRQSGDHADERPSKKQRLRFSGDVPDPADMLDTPAALLRWDRLDKCFLFLCDSKMLAEVVCGHAALHDVGSDKPVFDRMANGLFALCGKGWRPPQLAEDPVQWMPRKHNKVADGLADLTMDRMNSWSKRYPTKLDPKCANIVIQSDGGRRSETCAAASVIIGIFGMFEGETLYQPWYAEGVYIPVDVTVFQAEMIALDRAIERVAHELV